MNYPTESVAEELVADGLMTDGIALGSFGSLDAFVRACGSMGEILAVDDVWQMANGANESPEPVPFHSDGAAADVVAWFCIRQDEQAGDSLLADCVPLLKGIAPEHRAQLRSIDIPYYDQMRPEKPAGYCALLSGNDETDWRINYVPWQVPELSEGQKEAVAAFANMLSKDSPTSLRLSQGQALFIDNWRILHARGPLTPGSRRHLKRIWLRTRRASRLDRMMPRPGRRQAH